VGLRLMDIYHEPHPDLPSDCKLSQELSQVYWIG